MGQVRGEKNKCHLEEKINFWLALLITIQSMITGILLSTRMSPEDIYAYNGISCFTQFICVYARVISRSGRREREKRKLG